MANPSPLFFTKASTAGCVSMKYAALREVMAYGVVRFHSPQVGSSALSQLAGRAIQATISVEIVACVVMGV
jgi:hypothetical protein